MTTQPERPTPELPYLEAKFAGLTCYGLSAQLLAEVPPTGRPLHGTVLRRQVQGVAQRLEDELGEERSSFIEGCPATGGSCHAPTCPSSSAWTAVMSPARTTTSGNRFTSLNWSSGFAPWPVPNPDVVS